MPTFGRSLIFRSISIALPVDEPVANLKEGDKAEPEEQSKQTYLDHSY